MVNLVEAVRLHYAEHLVTDTFTCLQELPNIFGNNRWKPGREAKCCAFSKNKKWFAWSSGHGFKIIQLPSDNQNTVFTNNIDSRVIDCGSEITSLEFAPPFHVVPYSCDLLAVGLKGGNIKIWNVATGVIAFHLADHSASVSRLSFAPNGQPLMISCSLDKSLKVWDLADGGNMTLTMKGHNHPILCCAFSPTNQNIIASVGQGKAVIIWSFKHKRCCSIAKRLRGHHNDVVSCSWSPDGALLATSSHDTTVIIWNPELSEKVFVLGHLYPSPQPIYAGGSNGCWVSSVSFSSDGSKLATVCEDNRIRVWKLWKQRTEIIEATLSRPGFQCRFSSCGKMVAVGKDNGTVTMAFHLHREVLSLKHLCRMAARKAITSQSIEAMHLPHPIKNYLLYRIPLD